MVWKNYKNKEKIKWDNYWQQEKEKISIKKKITKSIRNCLFVPECSYYLKKYIPKEGLIVEAGSGSSSIIKNIKKSKNSIFISIDFSFNALTLSKDNISNVIQADIFRLPFKDKSLSIIWNSGVMEHFYKEDIKTLLKEFRRVLKDNGRIILFWPTNKLLISKILWILIRLFKKEIVPLAAWEAKKTEIKDILNVADFKNIRILPSYTLIYYIIIADK